MSNIKLHVEGLDFTKLEEVQDKIYDQQYPGYPAGYSAIITADAIRLEDGRVLGVEEAVAELGARAAYQTIGCNACIKGSWASGGSKMAKAEDIMMLDDEDIYIDDATFAKLYLMVNSILIDIIKNKTTLAATISYNEDAGYLGMKRINDQAAIDKIVKDNEAWLNG